MAQNILLIMPDFFTTQKNISFGLEQNGYTVFSYSDRPSANNFVKGLIRINRHLAAGPTRRYLKRIIRENAGRSFEAIIIIDGQSFSVSDIKYLFSHISHQRSIFYMWDALSFLPYNAKFFNLFDHTITFSLHDYENGLFQKFLPLFIPMEYAGSSIAAPGPANYQYDFCFVGTGKPSKYGYIKAIEKACKAQGKTFYSYLYLPSRLAYFFSKIKDRRYRKAKLSDFHFKKLAPQEINELYNRSRYIVDCGNPDEGGLALRVFECIGREKKLLLTNTTITKYRFYSPNNFLVWNGQLDLSSPFFTSPYQPMDASDISLTKWTFYLSHPELIQPKTFLRD